VLDQPVEQEPARLVGGSVIVAVRPSAVPAVDGAELGAASSPYALLTALKGRTVQVVRELALDVQVFRVVPDALGKVLKRELRDELRA
jgi:hypothetical protein